MSKAVTEMCAEWCVTAEKLFSAFWWTTWVPGSLFPNDLNDLSWKFVS